MPPTMSYLVEGMNKTADYSKDILSKYPIGNADKKFFSRKRKTVEAKKCTALLMSSQESLEDVILV